MVKPGSENPKDGTNTLNCPTFYHSCPIWCGPTAKYRWMTQMMRLQNPSWQNKIIQEDKPATEDGRSVHDENSGCNRTDRYSTELIASTPKCEPPS